jgi:uncharacterized membrane protein (DUF485 family)
VRPSVDVGAPVARRRPRQPFLKVVTAYMSTEVPYRAPDAAAYSAVESSPEFALLRKRLRRFVFPMTIAFFAWYALYVLLSAYARGFMGTKIIGNINIALVLGLLQFVTTFLIAWLYSRYADRELDPLAEELRLRVEREGAAK